MVSWLGVAEVGAVAVALALVALHAARSITAVSGSAFNRSAFIIFGICCIVFGVSHFAYLDFTTGMIPPWLVVPRALAVITGAAHIAAGFAIASGYMRKLAATLEAVMMASFVPLINLPPVLKTGSTTDIAFL
ncbi:MAG: hypothetical protein ABIS14_01825, partial [Sphingomonas sp.]